MLLKGRNKHTGSRQTKPRKEPLRKRRLAKKQKKDQKKVGERKREKEGESGRDLSGGTILKRPVVGLFFAVQQK